MSKADNMLSILWLLRSGKRMTAQQLADELEIHVRTVYRCIDSLCASGAPIIADTGPNGGYRILEHFTDAPLLFDGEEQKALVHASMFAQEAGYPFTEALVRAVNKLKQYTNEEQLDALHRHSGGLTVIQTPVNAWQRELLRQLEEATAAGAALEMTYAARSGDATGGRILDPYGIVHWKGAWYVVGRCRLRQAVRSFRVDRILSLTRTELRFERPPEFSARDYLFQSLLPGALEEHALVTVRIRADDRVLTELCQHWLFGHALEHRLPGEAAFRLGGPSLASYVPYFLLPYGRALEVLEPETLVDRLAEVSSDIARHYTAMRTARTGPQSPTDPPSVGFALREEEAE